MFWWIDLKPGWEWLADLTVIIWIGLGMTIVAWMKLWMAKPTFNTGIYPYLPASRGTLTFTAACSMTSIILFVVYVSGSSRSRRL